MRTIIEAECNDQTLRIIQAPTIASGGFNENCVKFTFCEKWTSLSKTAVFYQDEKKVYYALIDENDMCIVPPEVTAKKGTLYFGVFGATGELTKTSAVVKCKVVQGAITEDILPSDPTPDIYEQMLAAIRHIEELTQGIRDDADAGRLIGEKGVGIAKIEQTTTSDENGGENVMTITLTDNSKYTFAVKNGAPAILSSTDDGMGNVVLVLETAGE